MAGKARNVSATAIWGSVPVPGAMDRWITATQLLARAAERRAQRGAPIGKGMNHESN